MNEQDLSGIMLAVKTLQEKVAMLEKGNFKGILHGVKNDILTNDDMAQDRIDKLEAIAKEEEDVIRKANQPIPACTPGARRTSKEWQEIFCTITVLDPDGWDRTNFDFAWNCELITMEQYKARRARSTCRWEATGFKTMPLHTPEPPDKSFSRKMPIKGKMAFEIFRNNCEDKRWLAPFEDTTPETQQRWARIEDQIEKAIADRKIESVVG